MIIRTDIPQIAVLRNITERNRKRYYGNNMPHKDTFKDRELTTEPKVIQKRRQKTAVQSVGQLCLLPEIKMPDFV